MNLSGTIAACLALGSLVACSSASSFAPSEYAASPHTQAAGRAITGAAPSEFLYIAGGKVRGKYFVDVFDAQDTSSQPTPLYTTSPAAAEPGSLAVDSANDLYALEYRGTSWQVWIYGPGAVRPSKECALDYSPTTMSMAAGKLYIAGLTSTIHEYEATYASNYSCPTLQRILTDHYAAFRNGDGGLWGVVADPFGNIFDTWQAQTGGARVDVFRHGNARAQPFADIGKYLTAFWLTSDASGNLTTNVDYYQGQKTDDLAVFAHGAKKPHLYGSLSNGAYDGVALGTKQTELFVMNGLTSTVEVFSYDSADAKIGSLLRSFPGMYLYAQSIAVFSP